MGVKHGLRRCSTAALAGLLVHYIASYLLHFPLLTDTVAEWIMARTPSACAVWILQTLGDWAKPFAGTGALAILGAILFVLQLIRRPLALAAAAIAAAVSVDSLFGYRSLLGEFTFWVPAAAYLAITRKSVSPAAVPGTYARRDVLVMLAGTAGVALEARARAKAAAQRASAPAVLSEFRPAPDNFAPGLVRKAVTPAHEFYGMSKNAVDPSVDPEKWRLRVTAHGRLLRELSYAELMALPRIERYATLRCISNTLASDLMGNALWAGVPLSALVDRSALPRDIVEAAVIGVDGHSDSLILDFAFSEQVLFAVGMNGKALERTHGFPVRLLCPRFYGFKNVKWIAEIAFVAHPYDGTWPKLGYTKDAVVHTTSHIDRVTLEGGRLFAAGVSFAGDRGIRRVMVRADEGPWVEAELEPPLSPFSWTRWRAGLPCPSAKQVEARAQDGTGAWQESRESPLFPSGIQGPTVKRLA